MEQSITSVQPEEKPMSGVSKVLNIFFEPRKVFESLRIKPTWIVPFIIVAILGMGSFYFTFPYLVEKQIQRIQENTDIPEQAREQIIEKIREVDKPPAWQFAIAPVGVLVYLVVVSAALFFLFNVLMGGDSGFRKVFSAFSYSALVAIPGAIVKLPLIKLKGTMNVQTSLALLLSPDHEGSFIYSVLSSFDIFTVWQVILVSIGMGVLYRFTTKKAFIAVCILWIFWILLKSGLSSAGVNLGVQ